MVGDRLRDEAILARCRADGCSVESYAAAALAVSRRQFVAGDYKKARSTLTSALSRHRGDAREHPMPVSALWQEKGRVESHLGEYDLFRSSQIQALLALRTGLREDDPARINGMIEMGDAEMYLGRIDEARRAYKTARGDAERAGRKPIAAMARLRLAGLGGLRPGQRVTAADVRYVSEVLAPLVGSPDLALAAYDLPARLLKARVAERAGDRDAVRAWARSLPADVRLRPIMISADPVALPTFGENNCQDNVASGTESGQSGTLACGNPKDRRSMTNVTGQWIDVRFRIEPDGGVSDAEVLRRGHGYQGDWADRVIDSVKTRRYVIVEGATGSPQLERLERFTMTAPFDHITGDLMRSQSRNATVERVDLTPDRTASTTG